jgi:hypothetical protein
LKEHFQNSLFSIKHLIKNMNKKILYIGFLLSYFSLSSIAQVAMGKWRTHFAYNNVTQITQSTNKIYAISEGALFSIDKSDGTMEFYSKLNGLSSSDISTIEYDSADQSLLIIYSNGNIDIMSSGGISNIPDFYNKQMSASKDVNHIQFYQNKAYLSCNFGIIVLDMKKKEVSDTYYIGPNASEVKVLNTTVNKGIIYALTTSTIFQASVTDPNLVNYASWSFMSNSPGAGDFQKLVPFAGQLILLRGGKLFKQNTDNSWSSLLSSINATGMNVSNNTLNIFDGNSAYLVDNVFNTKTASNIGAITDAEYDQTNSTYWFAANTSGIIAYKQVGTETPTVNYYKPTGPAVNTPWDMTFSGQKLFVVPGGRWDIQYSHPGNVMMFENGVWSNILTPSIQSKTGKQTLDFMNVAVDPTDNKHFFVTSYGTGLYEFRNNSFYKLYNESNSTIKSIYPGDPLYMRIDGAIFDKYNNLFLTNSNEKNGVVVRLADSTWTQLNYPGVNDKPTLGKVFISNQNPNQKWVYSVRYTPGVCVFDDKGTIKDQSDDQSVFIKAFTIPELADNGQTKYTSYYPTAIFTIAQDKNGVVWVGTDIGPFLFNNLETVYNSNYLCSRVKIPRGDSTNRADYLLVNENIQAIAIDGANRKWIGTKSSGAYLMSENGQQTIHQFTTSNSPILSNNILSIAINPGTGEVFFGTDKGIMSYQSDAKEAETSFNNVYAYPNPVRQGFTGVITITGLVENTQVKITDINGNLICETVSNGSLATWDGKDVHGKKVNTGVYLAICVNADGTQSTITKILVIN